MGERTGIVTFQGTPLTLMGDEVRVGDRAPDFTVLDGDLNEFRFSSLAEKIAVISSVPSLDTSVCDAETKRFSKEAESFSDNTVVLTISMDLPFAQNRWCQANAVNNTHTLSDHRAGEFGTRYGVLIKELRLLARVVFIVDSAGIVRYIQYVNEIATEPDYQAVVDALAKL